MALVTNTNVPSLNAQRNLTGTNRSLSKSLERLSSGLRINRAGDDAAGLAISEKLRSQVRGLNQAIRNANDGISLIQTAEGAFNVQTNIIQRLRELAVQSASDSNTPSDRATLKTEADLLVAELTRIANTTEFNTKTLLDGSFSSGKLHIGANSNQSISFTLSDSRATALGKRATVTGALTDGAANGVNAGITPGEVTINGERVVTTSSDDQVSVLDINGSAAAAAVSGGLVTGNFILNDTVITAATSGVAAATAAALVVSAINAASITNVTARLFSGTGGSRIVLTAKKGTDISIRTSGSFSATSLAAAIGIDSGFIGTAANTLTVNGQSSALAKAAAVNQVKSDTTVTGTAKTTTVTGTGAITAVTLSDGDFYLNGVNIGAVTVQAADATGTLVAAINAATSSTGVVASVNSSNQLVLEASDGRNISVSAVSTVTSALNISNTVTRANVELNSSDAITIAGSNVTELGSGISAVSYQTSLTNAVSTIDISTQAGADSAILTLDAALKQLNDNRAQVGALQNRLEMATDNLATSSENLAASESRIRDADFALETAEFTRNQILLQAGTAILAQANTLPQLALQLLQ